MRPLRILAWCLVALVVVAVAASFHPMVRSVYRAFRPSTSYDSLPPVVPELGQPAVLVFSKTNGFRHADAISEGVPALRSVADRRGWSLFSTENGAVFNPEALRRFDVVVWLNVSGAPLDGSQRAAMQAWLESGGGFVGIHAALDDSHSSWEWYVQEVVGAGFICHAIGLLPAVVHVERTDHVALRGLDKHWSRTDEWYSFDRSVRGLPDVEVLASLDESTYEPRMKLLWIDKDLAMGDHPIVWTRRVGDGRAFLSAFGHSAEAFQEPQHLTMLESAIAWALRVDKPPMPH